MSVEDRDLWDLEAKLTELQRDHEELKRQLRALSPELREDLMALQERVERLEPKENPDETAEPK